MSSHVGRLTVGFPHAHTPITVAGIYWRISLAMAVPLGFAVGRSGVSVVWLVLLAVTGALIADLALSLIPVRETNASPSAVRDGRAVAYALFVAALIPTGTPPALAAAAGAVAMVVGVLMQGGVGAYWLHPALVALAIVLSTGVAPSSAETVVATSEFTAALGQSRLIRLIEVWLVEFAGTRVPPEAWASVTGIGVANPSTAAASMALPVLAAAMIVFGEDLVPLSVPIVFLVTVAAIGEITSDRAFDFTTTGTTLLVAVVAFADPGVRPRRLMGMVLFALVAGLAVGLLRAYDGATRPEIAGLLLAGSLVPAIDRLTDRSRR